MAAGINWPDVRRVLVVRLRSIGDTVLATPSLDALRRFLPKAKIDVLLEDWVAPLLDGFDGVDEVIRLGPSLSSRINTSRELRRRRYDVAFNLHGGTTATFLTRAVGARVRYGFSHYRYAFLHTALLTSSADHWQRNELHSAEQQLALFGFAGVPVADRPPSRLAVTEAALRSVEARLGAASHGRGETRASAGHSDEFALFHPAAAYFTKQWPPESFARVAEYLAARGIARVAVAARNERAVLDRLAAASRVPVTVFDDLSLPEITALASKARLFVGNDSGIAHIAAAVGTPSVVVFGSSNRTHWRPWDPANDLRSEIVFNEFPCQPCPGHECREFGEPRCILSITPDAVIAAVARVLDPSQ